jgi:hypothetical protein
MNEQKIEQFWRDATAEDIAKVMKGEKVEARFKSVDNDWPSASPREGFLAGWSNYDKLFQYIDDSGDCFRYCQVYDPPQWWLDRPDPGEGWRLLEKFPDEPKLGTDEAWDCHSKEWRRTFANDGDQAKAVWYRRRIETNSPEIPNESSELVAIAMQMACEEFGRGDGVFNSANFEHACRQVVGSSCSIDGQVVQPIIAFILDGRKDVEALKDGRHYRYLKYASRNYLAQEQQSNSPEKLDSSPDGVNLDYSKSDYLGTPGSDNVSTESQKLFEPADIMPRSEHEPSKDSLPQEQTPDDDDGLAIPRLNCRLAGLEARIGELSKRLDGLETSSKRSAFESSVNNTPVDLVRQCIAKGCSLQTISDTLYYTLGDSRTQDEVSMGVAHPFLVSNLKLFFSPVSVKDFGKQCLFFVEPGPDRDAIPVIGFIKGVENVIDIKDGNSFCGTASNVSYMSLNGSLPQFIGCCRVDKDSPPRDLSGLKSLGPVPMVLNTSLAQFMVE